MGDDRRLILFVKQPLPGRVKTRLAASLGPELAADIYRAMAEDCLRIGQGAGAPLTIAYDPPEAGEAVAAWLGADAALEPQRGADLGERMEAACEQAFATGAVRALLMGSDVPDAPPDHLLQAFALLGSADAVLAPCLDGGFWCVGFRNSAWRRGLFAQVPWSSGQTLSVLAARLHGAGLSLALLPAWQDVDTIKDLQALQARQGGSPATATRTRTFLPDLPHA